MCVCVWGGGGCVAIEWGGEVCYFSIQLATIADINTGS